MQTISLAIIAAISMGISGYLVISNGVDSSGWGWFLFVAVLVASGIQYTK